jgi:hypothetical protein
MKPDDFEKRLQREPLRKIPPGWREEILRTATPVRRTSPDARHSWLTTLLWPNPKAWAGLAAVWVMIFALQFSARENSRTVAMASAPQPATVASWKDQQQILVELMGNGQPNDADRPRHLRPQPRSERHSAAAFI